MCLCSKQAIPTSFLKRFTRSFVCWLIVLFLFCVAECSKLIWLTDLSPLSLPVEWIATRGTRTTTTTADRPLPLSSASDTGCRPWSGPEWRTLPSTRGMLFRLCSTPGWESYKLGGKGEREWMCFWGVELLYSLIRSGHRYARLQTIVMVSILKVLIELDRHLHLMQHRSR